MSTQFQGDAIYWVEVDKIVPNPYQPRREFDEERLEDLAESIRMYGVLQPLTVTRREVVRDDGGLSVEYELIAGERRHRASKIAGLKQVPVIIRSGPENAKIKLEIAIIENLQREDLNVVDRALAFKQLADEFQLKNTEIAKKMGKSREYISNTLRVLMLPEHMLQGLRESRINEGHARPLLMLKDRPQEQETLFKEITIKKLAVREAERIARSIARDKVRVRRTIDPRMKMYEERFAETLGTRVQIEDRPVGPGGKLVIDFFSPDDLQGILDLINASMLRTNKSIDSMMNAFIESQKHPEQKQSLQYPISTPHVELVSNTTPFIEEVVNQDEAEQQQKDSILPMSYTVAHQEKRDELNDSHLYVSSYPQSLSKTIQNEEELPEQIPPLEPADPYTSQYDIAQDFQSQSQSQSSFQQEDNKNNDDDDLYSISKFTI